MLRNHKLYYILGHFNFFFDCFLGSFVCFVRMAKSSMAALFFMPRLDYSIFGRFLERTDMGFISYVTFIHMDVNQSHPVKNAFCELLQQSLKKRNKSPLSSRSKTIRNKWFVAVTLARNQSLKKQRKHYLFFSNKIQKVESFEQFLERRVKTFFSTETRKRSRSVPSILDETTEVKGLDYECNQFTTVNYRNRYEDCQQVVHAEEKRGRFAKSKIIHKDYYENERLAHDYLNSSMSTNNTILNYTTDYRE